MRWGNQTPDSVGVVRCLSYPGRGPRLAEPGQPGSSSVAPAALELPSTTW